MGKVEIEFESSLPLSLPLSFGKGGKYGTRMKSLLLLLLLQESEFY